MHSLLAKVMGIVLLLLSVVPVCDGLARPVGPTREGWTEAELGVLESLSLDRLPAPPHDPSNAAESLPAAVELGRHLFSDARFSRNGAVSCASCHDPGRQFQDGLPLARGVGVGSRRAMPIVGAAYGPWLFWDGRKDSLWSQALGPLEDAVEHGGTRSRYAHLLQAHYRAEYEAVFGALPDLGRVPLDAGPAGSVAEQSAWHALDGRARAEVSRVFANMGKAIAAYEKTLRHGESRFDRYVEALAAPRGATQTLLSAQEIRGLRLFIGPGQCATCHNGPLLSDGQFHNTGVAPRDPAQPDPGRAAAVEKLQRDEFNCLGPFSDARPAQCPELRFMVTGDPALDGAFKTPGLRGVSLRAPYMHAGQMATLHEVIAHYVKAPDAVIGHTELAQAGRDHAHRQPIRLSSQDIEDLAAFLGSLSPMAATGAAAR